MIVINIKSLLNVNLYKSLKFYPKMHVAIYKRVRLKVSSSAVCKGIGMLKLGKTWNNFAFSDSQFFMGVKSSFIVKKDFSIMSGFNISINNGASLSLGSGYINYGCNIACFDHISIGDEVAIGESVTIRDSDNHWIEVNI